MSSGSDFRALADTLEKVKATSKKNEKVAIVASYISGLSPDDAEFAARVATGRASKRGSRDEAQVGYSTLLSLLEEVCNVTESEVSRIYLRHGDLGEVAEEVLSKKRETPLFEGPLTLAEVARVFERVREAKGKGSLQVRKSAVKSLLLRATPLEGKYLVKVFTGEMRTGLVSGLMEDSIAKAYSLPREEVAQAHMLTGDVGLLAAAAATGELAKLKIDVFRPVNFMLAEPLSSPEEVVERFGKRVYAEYKYDGVRAQVHKKGSEVRVYSRRLEEVTEFFPEVIEIAGRLEHDAILDGEIVPFSGGRPLPFQLLQRRLRRIKDFEEAASQAPVVYFVFDLLYLDGDEVYRRPLSERSRLLNRAVEGTQMSRAERYTVSSARELGELFRKSRELGYEGLVVKDPDSTYTMGKRGIEWAKLKEELDTIDAVIVSAEYGHGKRVGVISDYTFAVRDGPELKTIGKAYSGLTDEEIEEMTATLKRITTRDHGFWREVRPEVVIEVAFDSIQKSERHDSGYALRFPRIKRVRGDKGLKDIDDLSKVEGIFKAQRVKLDER